MEDLLKYTPLLQIVATLIAAGAVAYFASKNYDIAQSQRELAQSQKDIAAQKLKLELFDRRFKIFLATKQFLRDVLDNNEFQQDKLFTFHKGLEGSSFLYPILFSDSLFNLGGAAMELKRSYSIMEKTQPGPHKDILLEEVQKKQSYLQEELEVLDFKFYPFLGFKILESPGELKEQIIAQFPQ